MILLLQGAYKLSEDFAKPYFHKFWTEVHDVTIIRNRNVCSFIKWPRRPNCRRNARWTATKLLHRANARTHKLRSVGEAAISLQHWFTLFPQDASSDNKTIPRVTFAVCNRHEFHDLATLSTRYGVTKSSDNLYSLCSSEKLTGVASYRIKFS
jgi:hypothetical protein